VALAVELAFAELGPGGVRARLPEARRLRDALDAGGDARAAIGALLTCAYQPTANSGPVTRAAAEEVARAVGAEFHVIDVEPMLAGYRAAVERALGRELTWQADAATLQHVQARARAPSIWALANARGD